MLTPLLEKMLAERSTAIPPPQYLALPGCFDNLTIWERSYIEVVSPDLVQRIEPLAHYDLRDMD